MLRRKLLAKYLAGSYHWCWGIHRLIYFRDAFYVVIPLAYSLYRYMRIFTGQITVDNSGYQFIVMQLTILVWAEPKIKRPGAKRSLIVQLRISRSTQVAGETTP